MWYVEVSRLLVWLILSEFSWGCFGVILSEIIMFLKGVFGCLLGFLGVLRGVTFPQPKNYETKLFHGCSLGFIVVFGFL